MIDMLRRPAVWTVAAATGFVPAVCGGADTTWINADGGVFHDAKNWDAGVPGPSDVATFTMGGADFDVLVNQDAFSDLLRFDEGEATFDLSFFEYILDGAVVANAADKIALVRFRNGTVRVEGNGSRFVRIGKDAGATGTLLVANDGLLASTEVVIVGDAGDGTLTAFNGGVIETVRVFVADDADSTGAINVGAMCEWTNSGDLFLGNAGSATLDVTGGGTATCVGLARLGDDADSSGTATVDGAGSTWTCGNTLTIGNFGTGQVNVTDRGTLLTQGTFIADDPGSMGTVIVDGAGSTWTNAGGTTVGNLGDGTLRVVAGGLATLNGITQIGDEIGVEGAVFVDGVGTQWTVESELFIGNRGTGSLSVTGGASAQTARVKLGDEAGSTGSAVVDGPDSTWTDTIEIFVGNFGTGVLTVSNGGAVAGAAGTIGDDPGSDGTVVVDGAGSEWSCSAVVRVGNLGSGTLRIIDGGALRAGDGYTQGTGGELAVVLGPDTVAVVTVTGTADLAGSLDVSLATGFAPKAGTTFDIIAADAVSGTFDSITLEDGLELVMEADRVLVRVTDGNACTEDLDGSGVVDFADILAILSAWGPCDGCPEDLSGNGIVDFADILVVLGAWGPCP